MTSPPIEPLPLIMTTEEVAKVLRCPLSTIERYVHAHELPAIRIGPERRIRADDLLDFVAARPKTVRNRKKLPAGVRDAKT